MQLTIIILLALLSAFLSERLWRAKKEVMALKKELERVEKEQKEERESLEQMSGLGEYNEKISKVKDRRKSEIIELIKEQGKVRNSDVVEALDVSDATATRYLEELEQEGKLEQVGSTRRDVYYEISSK